MFGFLFRRKNSDSKLSSSTNSGNSGSTGGSFLRKKATAQRHSNSGPDLQIPSVTSTQCDIALDSPGSLFPLETDGPDLGHDPIRYPESSSSCDEIYSIARSTISLVPNDPPKGIGDDLEFINFADDNEEVKDGVELESVSAAALPSKEAAILGDRRLATYDLIELESRIAAKDEEMSLLGQDIQTASTNRDNKTLELEALVSQLRRLREDYESSTTAKRKVEKQLDEQRLRNNQLTQELRDKTESLNSLERESSSNEKRISDLTDRLRDLEHQLNLLNKEKAELISEHEAIEVEREEEMRALQNGLDAAMEQRSKLQHKMEADFKALRNSFSAQEQQLMDDFEWKLRQIESNCKAKLRDKDNETEEKLKEARILLEREIVGDRESLNQERRTVEEQMRLVSHYKSYEAELVQLRGLTHEQQRALRSAARQLEHFKFNERVLHDEVRAARKLLEKEKNNSQALQSLHQRKLDVAEESLHKKLDKQKNELNSKKSCSQWEDRMGAECSRLEQDLCKLHAEEKHLAIESAKLQKDQDFSMVKQTWGREIRDLHEIISQLRDTITEMEAETHRQVEKMTEIADKESLEGRLKLESTIVAHKGSLDELRATHAREIESLQLKYEERQKEVQDLEQKLKDFKTKDDPKVKIPSNQSAEFRLLPPLSTSSPVNQSDSGCGDEESSEESEYELDEGEGEGGNVVPEALAESPNIEPEGEEAVVSHLREEVASLQGSIEKLTTDLVINDAGVSSDETESEDYDDDEESESDSH